MRWIPLRRLASEVFILGAWVLGAGVAGVAGQPFLLIGDSLFLSGLATGRTPMCLSRPFQSPLARCAEIIARVCASVLDHQATHGDRRSETEWMTSAHAKARV